jgi:probable rRNA maturation factor
LSPREPAIASTTRAHYVGPWRIDVTVREGVARPASNASLTRAIARAAMAAGAPSPASIGLFLADDSELAALNAAHMARHGPTDVLSFPLLPPEAYPPHPGRDALPKAIPTPFMLPPRRRPHLGDVVVSVERAIEQAEAGRGGQTGNVRWSAADELQLLVIHGTLHLCGWDHAAPEEEAAMRALEMRLLHGSD